MTDKPFIKLIKAQAYNNIDGFTLVFNDGRQLKVTDITIRSCLDDITRVTVSLIVDGDTLRIE